MGNTAEIRQLQEEGYTFHGAYSWNKEEIKKRAAEVRKEGNKARVVYVPGSKYSRSGSGGGWSVYWIESEANVAAKLERSRVNRIFSLEREANDLRMKLAKIEEQLAELRKGE